MGRVGLQNYQIICISAIAQQPPYPPPESGCGINSNKHNIKNQIL